MGTKPSKVVTRFAPSPTGALHIGGARTALFAWAFSRRHGGEFVLRMEDTDQARSSRQSARQIMDDLIWLGLDWDRGPSPNEDDPYLHQIGEGGPFFQSQRLDIYREQINQLLADNRAYKCFKTTSQLAAQRQQAKSEKRTYQYDRTEAISLSDQQIAQFESEGRPFVVRFRMLDRDITFPDEVRGEVTVRASELDDFVIQKADGFPTFHLAVTVDDALMGVTHVLRAQDHLSNTPKHWALQEALGFDHPVYAHMPLIFNVDGSRMSKRDKGNEARRAARTWMQQHDESTLIDRVIQRHKQMEDLTPVHDLVDEDVNKFLRKKSDDPSIAALIAHELDVALPEIDVQDFRRSGYLPDVICNYIALLGWSPGGDLEKFDRKFLTQSFGFNGIGKSNARFDRDKLLRFNANAISGLPLDEFRSKLREHLRSQHSEFQPLLVDNDRFSLFVQAYRKRSRTLGEPAQLGRFFVALGNQDYEEKAVKKVLLKNAGQGLKMLREIRPRLEDWPDWSPEGIHGFLETYTGAKEIGIGDVAQPLRVAVSGGSVSPPIDVTLAILSRDEVISRINRCDEQTLAIQNRST